VNLSPSDEAGYAEGFARLRDSVDTVLAAAAGAFVRNARTGEWEKAREAMVALGRLSDLVAATGAGLVDGIDQILDPADWEPRLTPHEAVASVLADPALGLVQAGPQEIHLVADRIVHLLRQEGLLRDLTFPDT